MLNGLDLFTGIGGITIALKDWVRPIAYCELDTYCQSVLLSRMASGDLCNAPIWDDIRTFPTYDHKPEFIDIIYGGFPCQDISIAGNGIGLGGERSGLFFEIVRLVEEIKPTFIFLENVPAITSRGGITVCNRFAEMGYDCRWCVISAASVGALHRRERWFLLAYSQSERSQKERQPLREEEKLSRFNHKNEYLLWDKAPESKFELAGMAHGISNRSHRVKALGNAVVPVQAKEAFMLLMGLK